MTWQPSADVQTLKCRAKVISQIRAFFDTRKVLEVDTPVMSHYGVSDPHIDSISVQFTPDGASLAQPMALMSSPEYAMKRLLAAGSGDIYQIAKAFRNGEVGTRHNPEFTLLEWYRIGYSIEQLMQEVAQLLEQVLPEHRLDWQYLSYKQAFLSILKIDPLNASDKEVKDAAMGLIDLQMDHDTQRETWLDLLMSHCVEPQLPSACFIYDYPASQCALAQTALDETGDHIARRFEVYINGVELANGYLELQDAKEQLRRFEMDNQSRHAMGKATMDADLRLVEALQTGLPDCCGVAIGIDRLLMLQSNQTDIAKVMAFNHPLA